MPEINPYASSEDDEIVQDGIAGEYELASPWVRLGAVMLDGLILSIPSGIVIGLMLFVVFKIKIVNGALTSMEDQLTVSATVGLTVFVFYFLFNGYLLARKGQTLGKMLCEIRIIKDDGSTPSLIDSFLKRYVLNSILQGIPLIGIVYSMIDTFLIFRESRKCLHDDIAGTIVIQDKKKRRKQRQDDGEEDLEDDEDDDDEEEETNATMAMILPVGRSGWAIAAGYLALISILIIPAPLALITGIVGMIEIRRNPKKRGMGRAIFGIVMGSLGTAFLLFILTMVAIEQLVRHGFLERF